MRIKSLHWKNVALATVIIISAQNWVFSQKTHPDTTSNARVAGTNSFIGDITYEGSGAGTTGAQGSYFGYNAGMITTGTNNSFLAQIAGHRTLRGIQMLFLAEALDI
jgi:hypothetical protein